MNVYTSHTMLFMCLRRLLHLHKNIEFSIPHIPYIFCCLYGSGDFHMLTIHWIFILHKPCYFCVIWDFPMFTKDWISIIHIPCCLVVWQSYCTYLAGYESQKTFTCAQKYWIFIPHIPCCLCVMGDFYMGTKYWLFIPHVPCCVCVMGDFYM